MNQTSLAVNRHPALKLASQYSQQRYRNGLLLVALLVALVGLSGCGNKGPLKLPEEGGLSGQSG